MNTSNPNGAAVKKKVLIADDRPLLQYGLSLLINSQEDLVVCGVVDDPQSVIQFLSESEADLVTVELSLKEGCGIDLVEDLHKSYPHVPTLVLSSNSEPFCIRHALRAGARGYVCTREPLAKILLAIRRVSGGRDYLNGGVDTQMPTPVLSGKAHGTAKLIKRLSARELEVFELLGRGHETKEMAATLGISAKTVAAYREHIKEKLNLDNSTQLISSATVWVHRRESVQSAIRL